MLVGRRAHRPATNEERRDMTQYIAHHEVKDVQHWLASSTRE